MTLVEVAVAISLFGIVSASTIGVITSATTSDGLARQRTIALELAQQQIEYVRQLNYADVGTVSGNPAGVVPTIQTKRVAGLWYELTTSIKYVSDPIPTSAVTGAHYKRARVIVKRKSDGKVLANIATNVSSASRDKYGGLEFGVINVAAQDYLTHESLGGVNITLHQTWDGSFSSSESTNADTESASFGKAAFERMEATPDGGFYLVTAALLNYVVLADDLPPADPAHVSLAPSGTTNTLVRLYKPATVQVRVVDGNNPPNTYTGETTVTLSSTSRARSSAATISDGSGLTTFTAIGEAGNSEPIVPGTDYRVTVSALTTEGCVRSGELAQSVPENIADYPTDTLSVFDVTLGTDCVYPPTPTTTTTTTSTETTTTGTTTTTPVGWATVHVHVKWNTCSSGWDVRGALVSFSPKPPNDRTTNYDGHTTFYNVAFGDYDISASYRRWDGRLYHGIANPNPYTVSENVTICIAIS